MQKTFIFLALISGLSQLSFCSDLGILQEDTKTNAEVAGFTTPSASPERTTTISTHTESPRTQARPASASPRIGSAESQLPCVKRSFTDRQEAAKHRQVTEEEKRAAAATAQACALIEQIRKILNNDPEFDGIVFITKEIKEINGSKKNIEQNKTEALAAILKGNISYAKQKNRDTALEILKAALQRRNARYLSDLNELIKESQSGTFTGFSEDNIKQLQTALTKLDLNSVSNELHELYVRYNTPYVRTVKASPLKRSASTPLSIPSPTNSSGRSSAVTRSNSRLTFSPQQETATFKQTLTRLLSLSVDPYSIIFRPDFDDLAEEYITALDPTHPLFPKIAACGSIDEKIQILEGYLTELSDAAKLSAAHKNSAEDASDDGSDSSNSEDDTALLELLPPPPGYETDTNSDGWDF